MRGGLPVRSDVASSGGGRTRGVVDGGVSGETGNGGFYAGIDLDVPIYSDLSGGRRGMGMGMGMGHTSARATTAGEEEEEEEEEEERVEECASPAVAMPVIGKADEVSKSAGKFEGLQAAGEEAQAAAEARNEEAQGVDGGAQSAEDDGAQAVDDDGAQEGLYAGASAVCGEDRSELLSASNQPRARMAQHLRGHFTAAALDPKHPIGKLCVPFAADIVLHLKNRPPSSWTSTHLDQLSAAVNNFLRDAIFAKLRVPLRTSALGDSVVEALWGAVEAGVYAPFSGPLRCAPRPCNTRTGLEP